MFKDKLLKVWKDPVWSKIISVIIIALTSLLFNWFQAKYHNIPFKNAFYNLWTKKIEFWTYIPVSLISISIYLIWKKKAKNILFRYDSETLELDRRLFNKIITELLPTDKLAWIANNGFSSNPFESWRVDLFFEITEEADKATFYFMNPKLEKVKIELIKELSELNEVLIPNIFGAGNDWLGIPSEWSFEKFQKAKDDIKPHEDSVGKKYGEFIRTGRSLLKM